jgi:predicted DNA-binding protein (UPF0251 family)
MMGHGPGRGRKRGPRWISTIPDVRRFSPMDREPKGVIRMSYEELETIRLIDYLDLSQEEAASQMGISRKSLWSDLRSARAKLAAALVEGREIVIEGGDYVIRERSE